MPKATKIRINVKDCVEDTLDLSLSDLTEVPVKEIALFKCVTTLDLSNNKLITLGETFSTLINIVKLDLSRNQIKFLPEEFGNLKNLTYLDLYSNKLEHLPLSFGNLKKLRYLDLKANPLTPALSKIVGLCLTAKDCNISAKNTVNCMAHMQEEMKKIKKQLEKEDLKQLKSAKLKAEDASFQKPKKTKKSKNKLNKAKKEADFESKSTKINSIRTKSDGSKKCIQSSSTALKTIFSFFLLLVINILVIYVIMFKNPEIAEKLVECIPHQYRNWILTKLEYFRLYVWNWVQQFRVPIHT